jgi:hypothetical protein
VSGIEAPNTGRAAGSPRAERCVFGGTHVRVGGAEKAEARARAAGLPRGAERSRPGCSIPDTEEDSDTVPRSAGTNRSVRFDSGECLGLTARPWQTR